VSSLSLLRPLLPTSTALFLLTAPFTPLRSSLRTSDHETLRQSPCLLTSISPQPDHCLPRPYRRRCLHHHHCQQRLHRQVGHHHHRHQLPLHSHQACHAHWWFRHRNWCLCHFQQARNLHWCCWCQRCRCRLRSRRLRCRCRFPVNMFLIFKNLGLFHKKYAINDTTSSLLHAKLFRINSYTSFLYLIKWLRFWGSH